MQTIDKRTFLRGIKWDAEAGAMTLEAALKAALQGQIQEVATGKVLVGSTGNGQNVTFALPASSAEMSPSTVSRIISELYDLYEESSALVSDDTNDSLIFAQMMAALRPVRSFTMNCTNLRCA